MKAITRSIVSALALVMSAAIAGYAPSAPALDLKPVRSSLPYNVGLYPSAQLPGPDETLTNYWNDAGVREGEFRAWLADMKGWRGEQLNRAGYVDDAYRRADLQWVHRNIIQTKIIPTDPFFYDPVAGRYTVNRFLDDSKSRYGGVDSVLLWPAYPNIGIDDRNQVDWHHDLPGGVEALKTVVEDFHRAGVKVFLSTQPWDWGTRDGGQSSGKEIIDLILEIGADGLNGDTYRSLPKSLYDYELSRGRALVLEAEGLSASHDPLAWNVSSWGFWKDTNGAPGVSRFKWLEPRHQQHIGASDRGAKDRTGMLQMAFFNGVGYLAWENLFGTWNGITPRNSETIRRIARIQRACAELFASNGWEPHTPTLQKGVYSSKFPGTGQTLWTFVNRTAANVTGELIALPDKEGCRYFDLWLGSEITPRRQGEQVVFSLSIEAHGFGAILAIDATAALEPAVAAALAEAAKDRRPLASFSNEWVPALQRLVETPNPTPVQTAPEGMVEIPGGWFDFKSTGLQIESRDMPGTGVQYPWESAGSVRHEHRLEIKPFFIDRTPVTNRRFKQFLDATHYRPKDAHNFLRLWRNGQPPSGWEEKPVTWVSLEDARAYAAWSGKRLPHDWEWQFAAGGADGRAYPWGNDAVPDAKPQPQRGNTLLPPDDVTAHPLGASPFGVLDLVGNVWQWTDEYLGEHVRFAVLKGGSSYYPRTTEPGWYFPQPKRLEDYGKYLLVGPSYDRSGAIGFRCVVGKQTGKTITP